MSKENLLDKVCSEGNDFEQKRAKCEQKYYISKKK